MSGRPRASTGTGAATLLAIASLLLAGCGSPRREDPILRLSATEALEQGKTHLDQENYREARKYLSHAFEVEPNSASGREGLLLAADALFLRGGHDSFVEAESRYRDFLNRFPTSPRADYAQYRLALSLARRIDKPNRAQHTTEQAINEIGNLVRFYPTSDWIEEAQAELELMRSQLAEHEYVVARFYLRYGSLGASIERAKYLLDNYPSYPDSDKVVLLICRAYSKASKKNADSAVDAREWCGKLRQEHPDSPLIGKLPKTEAKTQEEEVEG